MNSMQRTIEIQGHNFPEVALCITYPYISLERKEMSNLTIVTAQNGSYQ